MRQNQTAKSMKKAVIYARVSSENDRQNTARQVADLERYAAISGMEIIKTFEEHISGAKRNADRPVLVKCLDYCESEGVDVLLLSELSRLGRNVWEVQENVKRCIDAGINVYFQKEQFSLFTAEGKQNPFTAIFVAVLGTCAEMEREAIYFRLNSGREHYKQQGGRLGRKEGSREPEAVFVEKYPEVVRRLRRGGQSIRDIAKCCDVSPATVQKIKKTLAGKEVTA